MVKRINQQIVILFIIFFFALIFRTYQLSSIPAGFHQDEVVNTYVGEFILKNGQDLFGNKYPLLYFNKWGDYPPVLPMYVSGLGALIFGDTLFGARILTAILGALTIFPLFFLVKKITKNKLIALFAALLLAINPWHIAFSRVGAEGILAAFCYLSALTLFAFNSKNKNILVGIFISLIFLFTYLLYPGFRIIVPLTFLGLGIFSYFENKKISQILFFSFLVSLILTLAISQTDWGRSRFAQTSIVAYVSSQKEYFNSYIYNESSPLLARVFNNKFIYIAQEFVRQFLSYFSPVYLFVEGGKPNWFAFPNSGLFYLSNLFLLIIFFFLKRKTIISRNWLLLFFYLLIVAVVPAALTNEHSPNMHRSLLMVIFMILIMSVGFQMLKNIYFKKISLVYVLGIIMFGEVIYFAHNYFQHVSMYTSVARSDGNKQAALYLKENRKNYDKVYVLMTGWFPIYYLYFTGNYDINLIGKIKNGMRVEKIDNINFIDKDCLASTVDLDNLVNKEGKNLILVSTSCKLPLEQRFKKIGDIKNTTNLLIYKIIAAN